MPSPDPFNKLPAEIRRQIYTEFIIDTKKPIPIMALYLSEEKKWVYFFHGYGRISSTSLLANNGRRLYNSSDIASVKAALENYRNLSRLNKLFHQEVAEVLLGSQIFAIRIQHEIIISRHTTWSNGPITQKQINATELRRAQLPAYITSCMRSFDISLPGYRGTRPRYHSGYSRFSLMPLSRRDIQETTERGHHCLTLTRGRLSIDSFWGVPEIDLNFHSWIQKSEEELEAYKQAIKTTDRIFRHLEERTGEVVHDVNWEMRVLKKKWSGDMLDRVLDAVSSKVLGGCLIY